MSLADFVAHDGSTLRDLTLNGTNGTDEDASLVELTEFFKEASQEGHQPVITEVVTDDEGNHYNF